ncbi:LANO_0H00496g1_1 [Lachancea nothofagi CBS 11611]|uniref:Ubiquitin-like 1-activating enzyme E1A n=1 Tax=Lachancea nothofagi CBS 11611 TaxID=1266666 RepID=A0A1G4KKM9_9SACH|nr:LANO_0H00496g1_1 [Lachancea nothofagi CBS 11611]
MAAQARMRSARVLVVHLGALGTEITKNLVLSGIGSLCIIDDKVVSTQDLETQFFVGKEEVGIKRLAAAAPRIQDMNPRVNLDFVAEDFRNKPDSYFQQFDLIVATDLDSFEITKINNISRKFSLPLFVAGLNGLSGYIFVDLIQFDATDDKLKSSMPTSVGQVSERRDVLTVLDHYNEEQNKTYEQIVTRNIYVPFEKMVREGTLKGKLTKRQLKRLTNAVPLTLALLYGTEGSKHVTSEILKEKAKKMCVQLGLLPENLQQRYIDQFSEQAGLEFAPVAAILGGAVAQDVINILGKKQSPLNNFVVLDGISLDMHIFEL